MVIKIDIQQAETVLNQAAAAARKGSYCIPGEMETKIEQILRHSHLTYKYILLTGMLAIAVDPRAHPLALQSSAPFDGAFNARDLCHSVVVPFEKENLQERLGGSNEPFLNQPARHTHLSTDNSGRKGVDLVTLKNLIYVLESAKEHSCEMDSLVCVLSTILTLESRKVVMQEGISNHVITKFGLNQLIGKILEKSCEGETLALVTAFLLELYANENLGEVSVQSHPTNQSGSSSMGISDIDVYKYDDGSEKLILCIEAKDKEFNVSDVDHAVGKVMRDGGKSLIFIEGVNSSTAIDRDNVVGGHARQGFDLSFVHVRDLANTVIAITSPVAYKTIGEIFNRHMENIKAKDVTCQHFNDIFSELS